MTSKIIDTRMFIRLDIDTAPQQNTNYAANVANKENLINQIFLYDTVIVPTIDFGIVPALIEWFGIEKFERLVDSGAIHFLKRQGFLGYAGNGNGICSFIIQQGNGGELLWWQKALFCEADIALHEQLKNYEKIASEHSVEKLKSLVLQHTKVLDVSNELFMEHIVYESYKDIMGSETLREIVLDYVGGQPIDLRRLPAVAENQLKVLGTQEIIDEASLVLRVAEVNLELLIAKKFHGADLHTNALANSMLVEKLNRAGFGKDITKGFSALCDLNGLPDVGRAVTDGLVSFDDLWKLRCQRSAVQFRDWVARLLPSDCRELERDFVSQIANLSSLDDFKTRGLRFTVTTAASALNPIAGLITSLGDTFFVGDWLSGYNPKILFNDIEKLIRRR